MKTIEFIKEKGVDRLTEELGIDVKRYDNGLFVLNYNQIESPKADPIVMECRALILDNNFDIVSRSFDRFFNLGENGTTVDVPNSVVMEKADGSLINIYWNRIDGKWEIATRKSAFAEVPHVTGGSFREKVLGALQFTEDEFQVKCNSHLQKGFTYIFEFIGSINRHVTPYGESQMVLLAIRDIVTGEYHDAAVAHEYLVQHFNNIRLPNFFDFSDEQQMRDAISQLPALEEGYVVLNKITGERIKVKNPSFLAIFNLRMNGVPSIPRIIQLVVENDQDEYLLYFPEDYGLFEPWVKACIRVKEELRIAYDSVKHIEDQKEFALKVKDQYYSSIMFTCKKYKIDTETAFNQASPSHKETLIIKNRMLHDGYQPT